MSSYPSRLVGALKTIFSDGPIDSSALRARLEQAGLRRIDDTDIYFACHEHALAVLDSTQTRWVPTGWASPRSGAEPDGNPARVHEAGKGSRSLTRSDQRELARLRASANLNDERADEWTAPLDPEWQKMATEAAKALASEHNEVTRTRSTHDVALTRGTSVVVTEARKVMRFEMQGDAPTSEGQTATLITQFDKYEVEVVAVYGTEISLSVSNSCPDLESATLRCDLSWLLGRQLERLRQLLVDVGQFDTIAALDVVLPGRGAGAPVSDPPALPELNRAQRNAVCQGLGDGLTWLWGPPGTGKTTTLSVLIRELLAKGKRVLLTAPTNAAVDVALAGFLNHASGFEIGDVVRVGEPATDALTGRPVPVLTDEVTAMRGESVAARRVELENETRELRQELRKFTAAKDAVAPTDDNRVRAIEAQIARNREMSKRLGEILSDVRRKVCREAQLVAATTHQAVLDTLADAVFDVVIIDEASMVSTAMTMLVAGLGRGHTVIAGDFRQLPPVSRSDEPHTRLWLRRSSFESAEIDAAVRAGSPLPNLAVLDVQHRMHLRIAESVSDGFYPERRLATAESVLRRHRATSALSDAPIVVLDSSALSPRAARKHGLHSRYNPMHAQLVAALVTTFHEDATAALISPFGSQATLLDSLLDPSNTRHAASTVHRFQGGEANVVLFDAVDTTGGGMKLHQWFERGHSGSDGARLINVAASRARDQLILVADLGRIHRARTTVDAVHKFTAAALAEAEFLRWKDVVALPGSPTTQEPGLERLISDIGAAREAIDIWSGDLDPRTARPIVAALADVAGEVPVSIWYPPSGGGDLPDVLAPLRYSSVCLRPCSPVRESTAVVGDALWTASSPLLSEDPGRVLRTANSQLARAVRRALLRRKTAHSPGSGDFAETCACGRLLVREEATGGPRAGVWSACRKCDGPGMGKRKSPRR
ncbi:AAA domain-containing protein [Rhodococcus spongiicola]|uniref:AAA family ATPase n=1 Tax=Rhodococcus spongiicola TaxID=2487352 RepID=A0A3S3BPB5_9NOCA|nr:AAA domain-containing protein [Rhodococcus spongiicola]RVW05993.1 AAA family ATPase [Rhodococcus spongiicola]